MIAGMKTALGLATFAACGAAISYSKPPPASADRPSVALAIASGKRLVATAPAATAAEPLLVCRRVVQIGPVGVGQRCVRRSGPPNTVAGLD